MILGEGGEEEEEKKKEGLERQGEDCEAAERNIYIFLKRGENYSAKVSYYSALGCSIGVYHTLLNTCIPKQPYMCSYIYCILLLLLGEGSKLS